MTKEERLKRNKERWADLRAHELELYEEGYEFIGGLDEVGRGPLAGPVVTACVVLPHECEIPGIDDSKKLSEKKRLSLDKEIRDKAISIGIGVATSEEIDRLNILNATKLAMKRAVSAAEENIRIDKLLIDAVKLEDIDVPQEAIVKGDEKCASISAASIIAKVARDNYMIEMDEEYPGYGFASNKGYGTAAHYEGLAVNGLTPIHRKTFLKTLERNIEKVNQRKANKGNMKKKFYAVKNGREIGIFETWDECKEQVNGFKGAEYKSFASKEEAKQYIFGVDVVAKDAYSAYVDGSYEASSGRYSGGAVILHGNEVIASLSKAFDDKDSSKLRNVAGEVAGSKLAIEYCIANGISEIKIFHDYEGVGKWADDKWKANLPLTQEYKEYIKEARKTLQITFVKVKGHSGNKYNELADKLARDVLK